jgi:hypothetical protein
VFLSRKNRKERKNFDCTFHLQFRGGSQNDSSYPHLSILEPHLFWIKMQSIKAFSLPLILRLRFFVPSASAINKLLKCVAHRLEICSRGNSASLRAACAKRALPPLDLYREFQPRVFRKLRHFQRILNTDNKSKYRMPPVSHFSKYTHASQPFAGEKKRKRLINHWLDFHENCKFILK